MRHAVVAPWVTRSHSASIEPQSSWDGRVEMWEDVVGTPAFQRICSTVIELAEPKKSDVVIDLGAGTGLLTLALATRAGNVVAVDYSQPMLARLEEKARDLGLGNVSTVVADLRWLPVPDESATLVVSNYAFHHLGNEGKELALAEARRVLRPGGRLVICDMMFELSLQPRDRALIAQKAVAIARRGPAGVVRLAKNAVRLATGRWEQPASADRWRKMLELRQFEAIEVSLLEHEAGIATARRPVRSSL